MTHKVITLEFIVPTVLAVALGILCSIGTVYLTDKALARTLEKAKQTVRTLDR